MATITNISQPRDGENRDLIGLSDLLCKAMSLVTLIYFASEGAGGNAMGGITAGCDVLTDTLMEAAGLVEILREGEKAQ